MKSHLKTLYLLLSLLLLPNLGYAASDQEIEDAKKLGKYYDQYATIAGGWYMNQKCSIFTDTEKNIEFEWYVAQINLVMANIGKNMSLIMQIQQSAKKVADSEKYKDCGKTAKEIVQATFDMSKSLNLELTHGLGIYKKGISDKAYFLKNYYIVSAIMGLEDKCHTLSKEIAPDVHNVYSQVTKALITRYGNEVKIAQNDATEAGQHASCTPEAKQLVINSLAGLRSLKKLFVIN